MHVAGSSISILSVGEWIKIWSCGELNPRPLECKSSALPTELQPHSANWILDGLTTHRCRSPLGRVSKLYENHYSAFLVMCSLVSV